MIEATLDPFTPAYRPLPTEPGQVFGRAASVSHDPRPEPIEREAPPLPLKVEPDGIVLTCGSALKPEPVSWLWRDWLAQGKLHILAGAPGQGKTTIALAFMATVTSGGRWPDGTRCPIGNVLMWTGEDDPGDTLAPRLMAMGADMARVFFVTGTRLNGEVQPFDPAKDMPQVLAQAERIGNVRMLVLDPVVSAVAGDSHKNTEVRRAMQPLVDLGATLGAVVLGITHFSKGGAGSDPASRVVGSIAFTAVARVVLVAAKSPTDDNENRRVLARSKSNIGPDDGGFEYHIDQAEPLPGIQASYIAWGGSVAGSARELLAEPEQPQGDAGEKKSALDAAADFLRQVLDDGPAQTAFIEGEAKSAGVSWASVRRAGDSLNVIKQKGMGGNWYWRLPPQINQLAQKAGQLAQDAQHSNGEQVEQVDEQPEQVAPESEVF